MALVDLDPATGFSVLLGFGGFVLPTCLGLTVVWDSDLSFEFEPTFLTQGLVPDLGVTAGDCLGLLVTGRLGLGVVLGT